MASLAFGGLPRCGALMARNGTFGALNSLESKQLVNSASSTLVCVGSFKVTVPGNLVGFALHNLETNFD